MTLTADNYRFPPATPPEVGAHVGPGRHDRGMSEEFAQSWAAQLALLTEHDHQDRVDSLVIGVGNERDDDRWKLVWATPVASEADAIHG